RLVAMHADGGHGGRRLPAVQEVHVDHGHSAVRLALRAGRLAGAAADAARRVDVELVAEHQKLRTGSATGFPGRAAPAGAAAFSRRQAETLNSGILLRGSSERWVSRFA